MKMSARNILLVTLSSLMLGCASTPKENEPAELTDFEQERDIEQVWSVNVGNGQGDFHNTLTPALSGDWIIAASEDGKVAAIERSSGKRQWQVSAGSRISGAVGVGSDLVLLGTPRGYVIALKRENGDELWRQRLSGQVLAPPQTDGERVIVQTYDGRIIALRAEDGQRLWAFDASVPRLTLRGTSTPVIADGMVLAGLANGRVVAVDLETGSLRWEQRVSVPKGSTEIERLSDVDGDLLVDNGMLYVVGFQGSVQAIDIRSGRRLWERDASSYVGLTNGYGNVYVVGADGGISAYDAKGQNVGWTQTVLKNRRLTAPAILSGSIAVGDFEGFLHFLSQLDGHLVARVKVDGDGLRAPMLVADNTLYVYGNSGKLAAYQFESTGGQSSAGASRSRFGPRK